jgi:hypothetical protein
MKSRINFLVLFVLLVCCRSVFAGQVVGYITDPANYSIYDYTDIMEAWVEKDGTNLIFVMVMRGTIPSESGLPNYDDTLTYLWFVDADNDPTTGQNPGWIGSEFNIRVVISQNPGLAGNFVDVVGPIGGGGAGTVDIIDNKIQITIDRSQVGAVRRLHWRSDAWVNIEGTVTGNGLTPISGLARVCRYGVLFDPYSQYNEVGENYITAYMEPDANNPVISLSNQNSGQENIFLSDERKYPEQDDWQILGQTTGHAGPCNLRTSCRLDVENSEPNHVSGNGCSSSFCKRNFILDGAEGETGLVPHGVFFLKWSHDYHIFASDDVLLAFALTNGQIVLYQVEPEEGKGSWAHQEIAFNKDIFHRHEEVIDLSDIGLEFGITYWIGAFLTDNVCLPEPSGNAEAVSDASLLLNIDAAVPEGDVDKDWDVDLWDFALFAGNWLENW